ncbi:hypothetical protein D1871_02000, partial [Nakamurella silvestris]
MSVPDSPVFDDHTTDHVAVTSNAHVFRPPVRSGVDRSRNTYPQSGTPVTCGAGGSPAPIQTTGLLSGSSDDHLVDDNVAGATTDTPPAATRIDTGSGSSTHNHVQVFTATRSGTGPTCATGAGTLNRPTA